MDGLIVGVVSGIVTSWVLYFGKYLWDSRVKPYLAEIRYQGVIISGTWTGKTDWVFASTTPNNANPNPNPPVADQPDSHAEWRLFLEQSAQSLAGTFSIKIKSPQKQFALDFKVNGYMWEGYVTLNCIPVDRRVTSYATMLLKLHLGGVTLVGQMCFRMVEDEKVGVVPIGINRTEVIA